ncbi:uncharacterized protein LOC121489446 [Vulpes lagopus]|uniref:uncharacterized protein LOC121489446 n=1 Tax=Vulpes lagopus TaxID=494514 RepID=UPI001BC8DBAF|nr:uncharacterized protein LOC121489446 [Vulpes lagopus]
MGQSSAFLAAGKRGFQRGLKGPGVQNTSVVPSGLLVGRVTPASEIQERNRVCVLAAQTGPFSGAQLPADADLGRKNVHRARGHLLAAPQGSRAQMVAPGLGSPLGHVAKRALAGSELAWHTHLPRGVSQQSRKTLHGSFRVGPESSVGKLPLSMRVQLCALGTEQRCLAVPAVDPTGYHPVESGEGRGGPGSAEDGACAWTSAPTFRCGTAAVPVLPVERAGRAGWRDGLLLGDPEWHPTGSYPPSCAPWVGGGRGVTPAALTLMVPLLPRRLGI